MSNIFQKAGRLISLITLPLSISQVIYSIYLILTGGTLIINGIAGGVIVGVIPLLAFMFFNIEVAKLCYKDLINPDFSFLP